MRELSRRNSSRWVSLMTFSAGFMNAEATISPALAVSHHTGNLTQLAIAIRNNSWTLAATYFGLIVVFFIGSTIAGMLFYQCSVGKSRRYGHFLMIQGLLYAIMSLVFPSAWIMVPCFFASLSLGLQNGILQNFRGVTTRVTHMTGYLTDAGVALGRKIRGEIGERWKFHYFLLHVAIFLAGAVLGALMRPVLLRYTVTISGAIQVLCGIVYLTFVIPEHERTIK